MMNRQGIQMRGGVWWRWSVANAAGWTPAWALALTATLVFLYMQPWEPVGYRGWLVTQVLFVAPVGAVAGFLIGIVQWVSLRREVPRAAIRWSLASATGWAVGVLAFWVGVGVAWDAMPFHYDSIVVMTTTLGLSLAVAGATAGILQRVILGRQAQNAGWWVAVTALGHGAAGAVGFRLLNVFISLGLCQGQLVAGGLAGLAFGALTGGPLAWLLQDPGRQHEPTREGMS